MGLASGAATLLGWALDVHILRGATTTWMGMAPNTALALIGISAALWVAVSRAYGTREHYGGGGTALLVAGPLVACLLAGSSLVEHWFTPTPTRLDLLLFAARLQRAGEAQPAGRIGPPSAGGILLVALAVLLLIPTAAPVARRDADLSARTARTRRRRLFIDRSIIALAVAAATLGSFAGLAHLYAGQRMFQFHGLNPIAFNTATAILVLAIGVLLARPGVALAAVFTGSDAGAVMARRLAPLAVVMPIVIGSLRIAAAQQLLISEDAAAATEAFVEMLIVVVVVLGTARQLRVLDGERAAEQKRLALILDRQPVGVVVSDATGAVIHRNPVSTQLLGVPLGTLRPHEPEGGADGQAYHADGTPYRTEEYPITRAFLERTAVSRETLRYQRPDGSRVTLSVSATPLLDEWGELAYVVATIEDVSEREAARAAAEKANAAKSEFLATMSHELRTPLNAIAGHIALVEMGIHGPVTEAQRDALGRAQKAEQHLLTLISNLLGFARLDAGRMEFALARVAVRDVLDEAARMIEPQVAAKGLVLRRTDQSQPAHESTMAMADHDKLLQTLLNLLANAIKFTPPVQHTGEPGVITMSVNSADDGRYVEVHVSDTGIGIPEDRLSAIFEPFVQARSELTRTHDGAGLGLSISRELARGMGGELRVRSVVGEGSTFTVVLPHAQSADEPREAARPGEVSEHRPAVAAP